MNAAVSFVEAVKSTRYTLAVSALLGFLFAPVIFKLWKSGEQFYDEVFPVVRMNANVLSSDGDALVVHLFGEKRRDCVYIGLYAYGVDAEGALHDAYRERVDGELHKNRPVGKQSFGVWKIWPARYVGFRLYSRHDCDGRTVMTKLVDIPLGGNAR